jgi:hypothetical protein
LVVGVGVEVRGPSKPGLYLAASNTALVDGTVWRRCPPSQIRYVRSHFGAGVPILFTPNFCRIGEYAAAYDAGAEVTVDGPAVLLQSPEVGGTGVAGRTPTRHPANAVNRRGVQCMVHADRPLLVALATNPQTFAGRSVAVRVDPGKGDGHSVKVRARLRHVHVNVIVKVYVNELRLGFSNTTRSPEGVLSHNNRKS